MSLFTAICAALVVLALGTVLPPLLRPDPILAGHSASSANLAVYRRQLAELESDLRAGIIARDQFMLDRDELEQRLAVDLGYESFVIGKERPALGLVGVLAVGLPLSAIALYLALGAPPPG